LGLGIYLEVSDQTFSISIKARSFVHRVLFDASISHEYRL